VGPLAIISPSNTFPNLTRGGRLALPPPGGRRGEPEVYYPTGQRNYVRVIAREDRQGVAHAMLARQLGLKRVYLAFSGFEAGDVSWTGPFRRATARLGVGIAGEARYDGMSPDGFRALADKIARSGADGILIGGSPYLDGAVLLKALRARLGPHVTIMAGDGFEDIPDVLQVAGSAARGLYVATSELPADALHLTPEGKRFTSEFGTAADASYALNAAQATEVVLQAIARSDGTRASVLRVDRYGDITPARIAILRITGSSPPDLGLPSHFKGAVIDRVETIPASLAG
jgi:branched-chain amino acid transport system substrate-binding protein